MQTVDEYIAAAPEPARAMAAQVRQIIKQTAPEAEEKLSYDMPYYAYRGRLVYWGAYKNYIGLYVMSPARDELKDEIEPYRQAKATLHFPLDQPLPVELIAKIIAVQYAANGQKE